MSPAGIEKEFAVVAGEGSVYQPDALDGFANSPETGVVCRARTKRFPLYGPAGEGVVRRIFISVQHRNGCAFWAHPVVDGQLRRDLSGFFSRPPSPHADPERASFLLALGTLVEGDSYVTGVRGTTFGLEFESVRPERPFNVETVQFEAIPLQHSRSRAVNE